MKLLPLAVGLAILVSGGSAFASAHSDYTKSFPLQTLKTFQFKDQRRISRDPLANNAIWASDVRDAIRRDLTAHGMLEATSGPDFYVAFNVGLSDRYDVRYFDYGMPIRHRGFRTGWWGWPRGYDVWSVPETQSTVMVDVFDAHTDQLVWRGYDIDTLNLGNPGKTLDRAVDHVLARFYQDVKKTSAEHDVG